MQNGTIFELYIDDKKSKYSSNANDILKSAELRKALYKRDKRPKLPFLSFSVKLLTKRKSQINNFNIVRQAFA